MSSPTTWRRSTRFPSAFALRRRPKPWGSTACSCGDCACCGALDFRAGAALYAPHCLRLRKLSLLCTRSLQGAKKIYLMFFFSFLFAIVQVAIVNEQFGRFIQVSSSCEPFCQAEHCFCQGIVDNDSQKMLVSFIAAGAPLLVAVLFIIAQVCATAHAD